MSELLGRTPQYTFIDELEPPVRAWSFEGETMASCDTTCFNELMKYVYRYRHSSPLPLIPLELLDSFNDPRPFAWYNIDYQRQISYNVLLLCEPRKEPEHNYYQEYVGRLTQQNQNDFKCDNLIYLMNNFYKAMTSLAEDIDIYRKEFVDAYVACREEQIRREQSI